MKILWTAFLLTFSALLPLINPLGSATLEREMRGINLTAVPSTNGCLECEATKSWWLHLRRCAECGHIGCCDNSPGQHATKHFHATSHPIIRSFEPGEDWFWDFRTGSQISGPPLLPPLAHPRSQPTPGPAGRVPRNWQELLNP